MMSLPLARNRLHDAISALCGPLWHDGHPLPSRYHQLRDAIADAHTNRNRTPPASRTPCQLDCLKLAITIDRRTRQLTHQHHGDTPTRLHHLTQHKYRPQDIELLEAITAEINAWAKSIDDFFAPHPVYLPDPCPQCGNQWTHRKDDSGERVRTRALAVTAATGAICQSCHAKWPPERLVWLGGVLGYHTHGTNT